MKISSGRLVLAVFVLAALAVTACAAPVTATRVVPMRSYVLGTLGDREVDLRDVCGGRPAQRIAVSPSSGSVLLGMLTLGLYTPRELRVTCESAR